MHGQIDKITVGPKEIPKYQSLLEIDKTLTVYEKQL